MGGACRTLYLSKNNIETYYMYKGVNSRNLRGIAATVLCVRTLALTSSVAMSVAMTYSHARALRNVTLRKISKLFENFFRNHAKQYGLLTRRNLKC